MTLAIALSLLVVALGGHALNSFVFVRRERARREQLHDDLARLLR